MESTSFVLRWDNLLICQGCNWSCSLFCSFFFFFFYKFPKELALNKKKQCLEYFEDEVAEYAEGDQNRSLHSVFANYWTLRSNSLERQLLGRTASGRVED